MSTTDHAYREVATEPLFRFAEKRAIDDDIEAMVDAIIADEDHKAHVECWHKYLQRHLTPPTWRGRLDIYHYDRLMSGLVKIVRTRTQPRVKYADFLRQHIKSFQNRRLGRRDVAGVMSWFRAMTFDSREKFIQINRDEEAEARRYDRLLEKIKRDRAGIISEPEEEPFEKFEAWEWEKSRYSVHNYEGRPRTTWRERQTVRAGARRTSSNSREANRFYSCE